MIIGYMLC